MRLVTTVGQQVYSGCCSKRTACYRVCIGKACHHCELAHDVSGCSFEVAVCYEVFYGKACHLFGLIYVFLVSCSERTAH